MTNPKHTDTSRSGDLVETLLCVDRGGVLHSRRPKQTHPVCAKAAARIEALEAENERFEQAMGQRMMSYLNHIEAIEAEVEGLRGAIGGIKEAWDWWNVDTYDRCASVVDDAIRAALGEK